MRNFLLTTEIRSFNLHHIRQNDEMAAVRQMELTLCLWLKSHPCCGCGVNILLVLPWDGSFLVTLYTGQSAKQEWPRRPIWVAELQAEHRLPSGAPFVVQHLALGHDHFLPHNWRKIATYMLRTSDRLQTTNQITHSLQLYLAPNTLRHGAGSRENTALNQIRVCLLCRCCS